MNKLIKYFAIAFVILFALLAALLIYVKLFFDPNDYREQIASQASAAIGREVVIDGDLSLSVFPWIGIEIGHVTLGNADGFSGDFASVDNAGAAVKLLPLLSKNIEINRVVLDGLNANLQVKSNGGNNWSDLGQTESPAATTSDGPGLQSFSIAGIAISNSQLSYNDQQTGQNIQLSNINLTADNISSGKPFSVDGGLLLSMPADNSSYQLQLDGELRYQADAGQLDFTELQLSVAEQGDQALPELRIQASGRLNTQTETLSLEPLQLNVGDLRLDAQLQGSSIISAPAINGTVQLDEFNPGKLAKTFGVELPQLASDQVLRTAAAELKFNATGDRVQISNLQASLDKSTINGNLTATLGDQSSTRGNSYVFDLNLDQINLDDYMPATPAASSEPLPPLDVELFRSLNARGKVSVGQLTINQLDMTDINASIKADRNGWQFQPITAHFYDGQLNGGVAIDASGNSPVLSATGDFSEVLMGTLLADIAGRDLLTGIARFDSNLKMDINQPQQTLSGEFSLGINDGAIKGVDLVGMLRQGLSIANNLSGGKVGGMDLLQSNGDTEFANLSGRFIANNGVIRNNDFKLVSPLLNVLGEGVIDLAADNIDYTVTASLLQPPEDGGDSKLAQMLGKQIPIHIGGTLAKPSYSIDPQVLLKIIAGDKLDAQKDKLLDKLRGDEAGSGSTRDTAAGVLGGLLGGKSSSADADADGDGNSETDSTVDPAATAEDDDQAADDSSKSSTEAAAGALLKGLFKKKKPAEEPAPEDDDGGGG
ncbi:MAG: AsmA family protein [Gammaproteobacteria bacterium]|jgi:AsmA protein|nr:AsmA family protein [Gammaproteobacteria bacterium]